MRASGERIIILAPSRPTAVTGVMAGTRFRVRQLRRPYDNNWLTRRRNKTNAQLTVPAPRPRVAGRSMILVANAPLMFPDPRPLQFNTPNPSAGRYRTVRSLAYKVRKRQETIVIAASKVCRPFPVPRRFRGQHPLAEVAAVAPVVAAVMVVASTNILLL